MASSVSLVSRNERGKHMSLPVKVERLSCGVRSCMQVGTCVAFPSARDAQRSWLSEQVSALFCHYVCVCASILKEFLVLRPYLPSIPTKVRDVR